MTTRYHFLVLLVAGLLVAEPVRAQSFFTADLTPAQETHDVTSSARGTAAFVLTDAGLRYIVTIDSLASDFSAAHFHRAEAGVSGGVVRDIGSSFMGNTASGVWSAGDSQALTDDLIQALHAGELYVNVHSSDNPAGEIRGQIRTSSGAALSATLTPEQEPGDVTSDGSGTAALQLTDAGVLFHVTVDGLTGPLADAHFHEAEIGTNGGVVRGIGADFEGNTAFGFWTASDAQPLTEELRSAMLDGDLYLNIHTAAFPGGEIRGQVLSSSGWGLHADLDASQSTGTVTSDGTGSGTFTLTDAGLTFQVTVDDLSGPITNAHFHNAPAGENGGVVRGIMDDFDGNSASGVWRPSDAEPLTDALVQDVLAGNIYLNIHTAANPGGEIRGQLFTRSGAEFSARLTTAQNGVEGDASGTANLSLTADGLAFRVSVTGLTGDITGAHFHQAPIGESGGVVRGIDASFDGSTASGVWTASDGQPLTDELIEALMEGSLYLNIHTAANPGGEIRGQVLPAEGAGLRSVLTNEQAGVEQEGSGTSTMTLTEEGLVYHVTVSELSGDVTNAHFHVGQAGVSGGVVHGIFDDFDGNTASGTWTSADATPLDSDAIESLVNGQYYINIHTAANPGGEIRGQVYLSSGMGAAVQMDPDQETHNVESDGAATVSLTLTEAGLAYQLTASGLTGSVSSAHFHNGPFGENGGVVRDIGASFTDGTASGLWAPDDAQPLTGALLQELLAGDIYLNVHTAAYPAGELRGQVRPGNVVSTAIEPVSGELPATFALRQNYPNPFNPATTLEFALTDGGYASLEVFDVVGRLVAILVDSVLPAGEYRVQFDAADLPSGVYFYRLAAGSHRTTRAMLLSK